MKRLCLSSLLVISAFAAAGDAEAKVKPATASASPLMTAISRCREMTDPAQRLVCYDSAAGALLNAANTGEVSVVDRGEVRKVRHSLFGFNLPRIPFFSGDTTANEAQDKLDSTIASVKALNNGYYQLVIADNNAVWVTTDDSISFDPPRAGQKIEIVRGALGNYFLRINGQNGVRGKRIG